jgi:hypothetical protein
MEKTEFKKHLLLSGFPRETIEKLNQLIRVINDQEERIKSLEAIVVRPTKDIN